MDDQEPLIYFTRDVPMSVNETLYRDQRNDADRCIKSALVRIGQHVAAGLLRDDVAEDLRALLTDTFPWHDETPGGKCPTRSKAPRPPEGERGAQRPADQRGRTAPRRARNADAGNATNPSSGALLSRIATRGSASSPNRTSTQSPLSGL